MRFRIEDRSMEPTLKSGDYIIASKLAYVFGRPSKGDVIVFKDPKEKSRFLVKRISKVINNKYFVAGDNKKYSQDSRHFGAIDRNLIVGKLFIHIKQ